MAKGVLAFVSGQAGAGRTALLSQFVSAVREHGRSERNQLNGEYSKFEMAPVAFEDGIAISAGDADVDASRRGPRERLCDGRGISLRRFGIGDARCRRGERRGVHDQFQGLGNGGVEG